MSNSITYLHNIQNEYHNILKSKEKIVFSDDLNLTELTMIVEEIDIFGEKIGINSYLIWIILMIKKHYF